MARVKAKHRRNCSGKVHYATEQEARMAASFLFLNSYKCPACKGWHVTKARQP